MSNLDDDESDAKLDAALLEFFRQHDSGKNIDRASFLKAYPEIADQLDELLEAADLVEQMAGPTLFQSNPDITANDKPKPSANSPLIPPDNVQGGSEQSQRVPPAITAKYSGDLPSFIQSAGSKAPHDNESDFSLAPHIDLKHISKDSESKSIPILTASDNAQNRTNGKDASDLQSSGKAEGNPSETDRDIEKRSSDSTVLFLGNVPAISLSDPGRAITNQEATGSIDRKKAIRIADDLRRVTPENTQPTLPCRFGDYVLEKVLGRGGMGVVYLAHQMKLERPVAIKMIRSGCLAGEEEIHRFYAEARSAARLDHPNIVSVHQCGEIDGHHFFSMDYILGVDLARRINEGPLPPITSAVYARDIARTIAYAHSQGVLHRDLKPANVLIDEDDQVIITDFGLAKMLGADGGLTQSGAAIGTPSYMSPEQAAGNSEEHSPATDVYSIGAILFALLTGKPPFQGSTAVQTIMDVIHQPAPSICSMQDDVPLDLDTIVSKCLQKQPGRRYESANALAEELDRYLRGEPILARPVSLPKRAIRWMMNIPIVGALVGFRGSQPTAAHRWAQRGIIFAMVAFAFAGFFTPQVSQWWSDQQLPKQIAIAAGMPGGMYSTLAEQLANNLDESLGKKPVVFSTDGSIDNLQRLVSQQVDLALLQATAVRSGKVAVVAPLYYEAVHLLVRKGSGVDTLDLLRGHRVALGKSDSGTHQAAHMILNYASIEKTEFDEVNVDWSEIRNDEQIDAAFAVIKLGHAAISDLLKDGEFHLLPILNAQEISLYEPTFRPIEISSHDYPSVTGDGIQTLATTAFLATRTDSSNRLVEECLKAIYSEKSPLEGIIPARRAAHWQDLPLHPAARRFFETMLERDK